MEKQVKPSSTKGKQHSFFRQSFPCHLFLLLLIVQNGANFAKAGSMVKSLPGFPGPLPFELETGYIGVGESEDVQLFYYFTKSESNPEADPLLLWFSGGPGCSAFTGLAYEIGPLTFELVQYDGSLPKLLLNPYSWTKVASIIFLDQPVGTGFSYARTAKASHSDDLQVSGQIYEFLRKWLIDHPEYISNPVYVGGDSYAGLIVPVVTLLISNGNEVGIEPNIDLKGYLVGNPATDRHYENYRVPFAHGVGLISNELYQSLTVNCKGEYQRIDPSNALCLLYMQTFNQLLSGVNNPHILEPKCPRAVTEPNKKTGGRRSSIEMFSQRIEELKVREPTPIKCRNDGYRLAYHWANDETVQEALHIRKGSIGEWIRCNFGLPYEQILTSAVPYHANLSVKGYRSLVYSGDHDKVVPHLATQDWIKSLNYQIIDDWRPWIVGGQVAGYTRTFADNMTFATVKGGGHTAPEYKPEECVAMFKRWLSYKPL